MDLIQVVGKRHRSVPILVTPDVRLAMDILCNKRSECGVCVDNPFFFATDSKNGFFNSWLVLNRIAIAARCDKPKLISSTRLRKYVATLAQVLF